ncbi:MAG TPA: calcium-binding protein, partial [Aliiroseovarius sp.]|nr:calcium-binding protein [Aliiroseovarius sp.]
MFSLTINTASLYPDHVYPTLLEINEGESFSITLANIKERLELDNLAENPGDTGWISIDTVTLVEGSEQLMSVDPVTQSLVPGTYFLPAGDLTYNEEVPIGIDYAVSYGSDSVTISGQVLEDYTLGDFVGGLLFGFEVQFTGQYRVVPETGSPTVFSASSGPTAFGGGVVVPFQDNDVWGTQELEDAKNVRFGQLQDMSIVAGELAGAINDLGREIDAATDVVSRSSVDSALGVAGLALVALGGVLTAPAAAPALAAAGLTLAMADLVRSGTAAGAVQTAASFADVNFELIASYGNVPPAQQAFIKTFGKVLTFTSALQTSISLGELPGALISKNILQQQFDDMESTLLQIQQDLWDTYQDFQKFLQYYSLGVETGAHDPSQFGSSGVQEPRVGTEAANFLSGLDGDDDISGMAGDDTLKGQGGDDNLESGAGDDILDGGTGADRMIGGPGSDIFYVDDAGDRVGESR